MISNNIDVIMMKNRAGGPKVRRLIFRRKIKLSFLEEKRNNIKILVRILISAGLLANQQSKYFLKSVIKQMYNLYCLFCFILVTRPIFNLFF